MGEFQRLWLPLFLQAVHRRIPASRERRGLVSWRYGDLPRKHWPSHSSSQSLEATSRCPGDQVGRRRCSVQAEVLWLQDLQLVRLLASWSGGWTEDCGKPSYADSHSRRGSPGCSASSPGVVANRVERAAFHVRAIRGKERRDRAGKETEFGLKEWGGRWRRKRSLLNMPPEPQWLV